MRLTGMRASLPRSPHLLLALVVVIWAGAFAAIKQLLHDGLAAPDIALGRYLIAAPGFVAALVVTRGIPGLDRRDLLRLVAAGLLVVVVYHLSLNAGERLTTAGTASVVVASAPGMTLAMALALGQERFSRRRALGLAVSFAGRRLRRPARLGAADLVPRRPRAAARAGRADRLRRLQRDPEAALRAPRRHPADGGRRRSSGRSRCCRSQRGGTLRRVSDLHAGGVALLLYLGPRRDAGRLPGLDARPAAAGRVARVGVPVRCAGGGDRRSGR